MDEIRFDDVEALQGRVSGEFGPFGEPCDVSQEMIDQFAELTGDRQWIHIDVERAKKESPFGGPVAHGFLTLALLPQVSAGARDANPFAISGQRNVVNYGSDKLRFLSPVPSGAKIHARSRLAGVEAVKKGKRIEL